MCKAFSCIVGLDGKVYWKAGLDSHEDIRKEFKLLDKENFTPVEITPKEGYLHPEAEWIFKFDDRCPDWWKKSHEKHAYEALEEWKEQIYSKINLSEAINPVHPLRLPCVKKVNESQIKLLVEWASVGASVRTSVRTSVGDSVWVSVRTSVGDSVWVSVWDSVWDSVRVSVRTSVGVSVWASVWASVWDSVRDSVWASVRDSVGDSVGDSVWDSVRDSVWDSVRDSVWAYTGSLFNLPRDAWRYTENIKTKDYPFESVVQLWKQGLVPSFDGLIWRLHSGAKADIVFEITKEELMKLKFKGI